MLPSPTKNHTPGPWRIDPGTNRILADVSSVGQAVQVIVCATWKRGSDVETRANANLIAAAPHMLAALCKTRDNLAGLSRSTDDVFASMVRRIESTIAMAEQV